jgi:hypothetical protein
VSGSERCADRQRPADYAARTDCLAGAAGAAAPAAGTVPMMTAAPQAAHAHSGHSAPSASGQVPGWICSNGRSLPQSGQFPIGWLMGAPPIVFGC